MLGASLRSQVRNNRWYWPIVRLRAKSFEREYRRQRRNYAARLAKQGLSYCQADTINAIRGRLADRGYHPTSRVAGQVRTLAIVGDFTWHAALLRELAQLGSVVNCDYTQFGLNRPALSTIAQKRAQFNRHILETLRREHASEPFDWVFAYVNGWHILPTTLETIHREFGIPTVNMCLDDKNSWRVGRAGEQNGGQVDIAGTFDVAWTSASVACDWYLAEGGRPIFLPEGCDPSDYCPQAREYDIGISFLGASYGCRPMMIDFLRRQGVDIRIFGPGWGRLGSPATSPAEIFSRSQINLGIGGIAFSEELTNVKGRDFDVPCTGGGVYLTTYNPDLAASFDIGGEILCYRNRDEAVEMSLHYLRRPDECRDIARRARERCLREHRWLHRFQTVLEYLGVLEHPVGSSRGVGGVRADRREDR